MSGVILYQSKYGATKKYAYWLSEATGFTCTETKRARIEDVQNYDTIILGGGIYASGIAGLTFLKKHINVLKEKKIIVFCAGASPYEESVFQAVMQHNMKDGLSGIPCFYCRGAWDMESMSVIDRNLCKLLHKAVAKKDPSEYEVWEKALMAVGEEKCDWTDKKYIEPILNELNK
jgi:menaquinone-dependent protoporphyrinogen IX oxidase